MTVPGLFNAIPNLVRELLRSLPRENRMTMCVLLLWGVVYAIIYWGVSSSPQNQNDPSLKTVVDWGGACTWWC